VVEAVAATFGYSHVSIYLLDGDALVMQHEVGYGDRAFPRIPLTHGIIGKVASTGRPVLLADVAADPAYLQAEDSVVSEVCVPLMDQGQLAGIFNIESTGGQRLGEADLRLMQVLSEHITLAMQQARLLGRTVNSEKRFRALVEHSADAIALVGHDGAIRFRSPVASRLLGYEADEYVGRNLRDWLHPDDQPAVAALFSQVLQAPGAHATAEVRFHHKNSAWLWIEGTATNLLSEPSVQAIVVNYHDISARKQAEQAPARQRGTLATPVRSDVRRRSDTRPGHYPGCQPGHGRPVWFQQPRRPDRQERAGSAGPDARVARAHAGQHSFRLDPGD
jgi:PAS domain S-box-containing protein